MTHQSLYNTEMKSLVMKSFTLIKISSHKFFSEVTFYLLASSDEQLIIYLLTNEQLSYCDQLMKHKFILLIRFKQSLTSFSF